MEISIPYWYINETSQQSLNEQTENDSAKKIIVRELRHLLVTLDNSLKYGKLNHN